MEDWLTDMCNSDDEDDLNIDDDACLLQNFQERNAASVPACVSNLIPFQAEVLQMKDFADWALRDFVPDDCYTFNCNKDIPFLGRRATFTGTLGPTFEAIGIDLFNKLFDIDFIDRFCIETNRTAEQNIAVLRDQNKLTLNSRFNRWTPIDRDKIISFFLVIYILKDVYPLLEGQTYFTYNLFGTLTYFAKIMSYNRFLLLKTFLNFVDSYDFTGYD